MHLDTVDWERINDSLKRIIEITNDERTVRKNIMEAIHSVIYYDFGDFCYIITEDEKSQATIKDPVVFSRFPREFQLSYEFDYDQRYGNMDYTKWYTTSSASVAYRESDFSNEETRAKTR